MPEGPFAKAEQPLVLWVGKDWKRPDLFVTMAEQLRDTGARFVLVGSLPADLAVRIDAGQWSHVERLGTGRWMRAPTRMAGTKGLDRGPSCARSGMSSSKILHRRHISERSA